MIDKDYLFKRFPEMQPIPYLPSLRKNLISGIGHGLLGERDRDPATNTYVTTVWLFLFHIPIFAFGSYRVTEIPIPDAFDLEPTPYLFHGRVPMRKFVKIWNCLIVAAFVSLVIFIWWKIPTTPGN